MSAEEYDLKRSADKVGQLYPVLKDAHGNIIDGFHRKDAKEGWREETLEHIDTHEKLTKARLISNKFRRQVSTVEVEAWINELAEIASKEHGVESGKISRWIADETGYKRDTVTRYLKPEYKDPSLATTPEGGFNPPSSIVFEAKDALGKEKYDELKERLVEEAKEELQQDKQFRAGIVKEERWKIISEYKNTRRRLSDSTTPSTFPETYLKNIESTFYKIRGWGIPMMLSMGEDKWGKALRYIQAIHDWTGFLLMTRTDKPIEQQPKEPMLRVTLEPTEIIEAEFIEIETTPKEDKVK